MIWTIFTALIFNYDYFFIVGVENDTEKQYRFTGRPDELPLRFRITNSKSGISSLLNVITKFEDISNFSLYAVRVKSQLFT